LRKRPTCKHSRAIYRQRVNHLLIGPRVPKRVRRTGSIQAKSRNILSGYIAYFIE
jgi:hypothetical protein